MPTAILKRNCPTCNKPLIEESRFSFGEETLISYKCGHTFPEEKFQPENLTELASELTKESIYSELSSVGHSFKLRPYQIEGIKLAENSNIRCLIADEQGLGKTIHAMGLIKLHTKRLTPAVVVTKATVLHQWFHEFVEWFGYQGLLAQVIHQGSQRALPGFDVYIISYDLMKKSDSIFSMIFQPIQLIILDECQAVKNHLADRSKAIQRFVSSRNIPHILNLSGTPIKNNAGEYFTVLNLMRPDQFRSYQGYLDKYVDYYWGGYGTKIGGLKDSAKFHEDTKDFIIRRTRKEVAKDIPEVDRQFFHVELNPKFGSAYAQAVDELEELVYGGDKNDFMMQSSKMAIMNKMRQLTGLSKVEPAVDWLEDWLENNPEKKIVVFAHHHNVVNLLLMKLNSHLEKSKQAPVLNLHAGLDAAKRYQLIEEFKNGPNRILLASTLAAGEALNLQFCSNAVMLERQWNPANEEQAEGRFARIGQLSENIIVTYFIASETIDEYFTELVEQKRLLVKQALDNQQVTWDERSLMSELTDILIQKGKGKWRL